MRTISLMATAVLLTSAASPLRAADEFKLHPLAVEKPDVPRGTVTKMDPWKSKIYEGTSRDWWTYVPAQYRADKPACLMVFQDGHDYVNLTGHWRVPTVFDNLIASGDMPVTIAVFINPGHNGSFEPKSPWKVSNRSIEYDTLGDKYSRFLLEEILPEVVKKYKLTDNPAGWAIAGASSGGICAFTVAWERPDKFRKVFSSIGSFTNIRGGNAYPYLIRVTERKPLRVFLADTDNDIDNQFGSWPLANDLMFAALKYMNYDREFTRGEGGHNSNYCGSIFPDAMKWLWRGFGQN
jgi:predicted alpha/beta superfamily hydrolase